MQYARFFVSQAKFVTSVKKGKSVPHSAHRITPKISFLLTKDSVLVTNELDTDDSGAFSIRRERDFERGPYNRGYLAAFRFFSRKPGNTTAAIQKK